MLVLVEGDAGSGLVAALERAGVRVVLRPGGAAGAPDVIVAQRPFDEGRGVVALSLLRPSAPPDASRILAELAGSEQRSLADKLRVPEHEIARRLSDLLPNLSRRAAFERAGTAAPAPTESERFALRTLLHDLEGAVIALMLACAPSDRRAAELLGENESTLRSKMRKHGIRSKRARSAPVKRT